MDLIINTLKTLISPNIKKMMDKHITLHTLKQILKSVTLNLVVYLQLISQLIQLLIIHHLLNFMEPIKLLLLTQLFNN